MNNLFDTVNGLLDFVNFFDAEDGTPIEPSDAKLQYQIVGLTCLPGEQIAIGDIGYLIVRRSYKFLDGKGQYHVYLVKQTSKSEKYAHQLETLNRIKNNSITLPPITPNPPT
ncbi:hypothetical protein NUH87_12310 [Pseudomonas batumici]|uniref:hypothetical protein n=1 Tax=Pseudomonas batumici TaxID=226910 RepID=UPI0030D550AF